MGKAPVELGTAVFDVESSRLHFKKGLTYFKLMSEAVAEEDKIKLEFVSPAAFRHHGKLQLLPQPDLVYGSLARRWSLYSDIDIPTYNIDSLQVSRYKLKTEVVFFKRYSLIGFKGSCEYGFLNKPDEIERWPFFVLSKYASIASLGYKTTMGMGQVRVSGKLVNK